MKRLSPKLLNIIMEEKAAERKEAETAAEMRKLELYGKIPGLEEAETRFKLSGIEYAKLKAFGKADEAQKKRLEMKNEAALIKKLLVANGYSHSFLEPDYACRKCRDTGYVPTNIIAAENHWISRLKNNTADLDYDNKNPQAYSLAGAPEVCGCVLQRYYTVLSGHASEMFSDDCNFEYFDEMLYSDSINPEKYGIPISPRDNIINLRRRCEKFISNFGNPNEKDLLFCGPTGTGKTFLANCTGREILSSGYTVFRQSAPRLFELINKSRFEGGGLYDDILKSDLLILDDLGVETPSASKFSLLYDILEARHNSPPRKTLKTIISTNLSMKDLFRYYDERIVSRLMHWYDALKFAGDDIRYILAARRLNQ